MEVLEKIINELFDILEEFFETFKVASGQNILYVLFTLYGFLSFSIVMRLLNKPTFVSWIEALLASVIMTGVCCINYINKKSIIGVKDKLKDKLNNIKYKEEEEND